MDRFKNANVENMFDEAEINKKHIGRAIGKGCKAKVSFILKSKQMSFNRLKLLLNSKFMAGNLYLRALQKRI